jgi:glycerol-3-phosphate dehydrogenase (NAD(P)+)
VTAIGTTGVPVCASKGLELGTLRRLSEVLTESLGDVAPVMLTGPSHAEEVARGIPTTVVAASFDEGRARDVQTLFSTPRFRVYTNADVIGCEFGGALKNVIAIAAGVCDGLGFGDNTKGALLTRGLAEMSRLGMAMGARRETFSGLTGMGDLIATAMSRHSRNRHVGERLGRGETLEQVLGAMVMVAEGVTTARAARDLGRRHGVELPIIEQVCALFEGRDPQSALMALMTRDLKPEE